MSGRTFTVETFNGHDNTTPVRGATFVGLQERGKAFHGPEVRMWAPHGLQEAMGWDPSRFRLEDKGREQLHEDGRWYGHPHTTPTRWALWVAGVLDGRHKVAVIDTHLINNAWGAPIRGERRLRRRLWRKGWRTVKQLRRRLEGRGYAVFIIGDLNRALRWWDKLGESVLGVGFDHIFYPRQVDLVGSWLGDANGSDHRPLFGSFRFKGAGRG